MKSDNDGCYHGNVVPEALFKVCQKMELTYCSTTSMNLAKARISVIEKVQL